MTRAGFHIVVMFSCVVAGAAAVTPLAASCVTGPTTLCLNDQRFKLEVQWKDFQGNSGVGQAVSLTSDTGYFWFFSSNNVELVVKVLDGRGLNAHFWVFFGALSNVEYTLTVTDSVTGSVKTYFNPSGQFASVGDTEAFSATGSVSSAHRYVEVNDGSTFASPIPLTENPEHAQALSTCVGTETSLCLNGGRFRVEVNWKDFQGNTGVGNAISLTADTGYFWFFNSTNVELVVKVLDARTLNNRFWVFYGALSNVEYEMTVTDTLTGNINTYSNPSGRFASTGDTEAFRAGYSVAARLDESRSNTTTIPTTGGTISATAADGTVFTLTVPDGALFSDAEVIMTPVASIDGLPLSGGLSAAVQLAPEGLLLFQPATLTINPPTPIPIDEEMTFALRGSGEEFFLYPPVPLNTAAISMTVSRLFTYGAGRGTGADQAAQQQRTPANRHDQYKQDLQGPAAAQRRELRHQKAAGSVIQPLASPPSRAQLDAIRVSTIYLKEDLLPIKPTECSDNWKVFLVNLKSFKRDVINLTDKDPALMRAADEYLEIVYNLLVRCYGEAYDRCKSANDPSEGVEMLRIWQALNGEGQAGRVYTPLISRCLTFELTFNSVIYGHEQQFGLPITFLHKVRATIPMIVSAPVPQAHDIYAVLAYEPVVIGRLEPDSRCSITTDGSPSNFRVIKLSIGINIFDFYGVRGRFSRVTAQLAMKYDPGSPVFTVTFACKQGKDDPPIPPQTITGEIWRAAYEHHRGEYSGTFLAKDWTKPFDRVAFASKIYKQDSEWFTEDTRMDLKHTPQ